MSFSIRCTKFIVVADALTGEDIALYFDPTLPDLHRELLAAARKKFEKSGTIVRCHGGGRMTVKDDMAVFYSKSLDFGRFENEVVLRLAPEHPQFEGKNFRFFAKAGADTPEEVLADGTRF